MFCGLFSFQNFYQIWLRKKQILQKYSIWAISRWLNKNKTTVPTLANRNKIYFSFFYVLECYYFQCSSFTLLPLCHLTQTPYRKIVCFPISFQNLRVMCTSGSWKRWNNIIRRFAHCCLLYHQICTYGFQWHQHGETVVHLEAIRSNKANTLLFGGSQPLSHKQINNSQKQIVQL